jgi:hypothetical protein
MEVRRWVRGRGEKREFCESGERWEVRGGDLGREMRGRGMGNRLGERASKGRGRGERKRRRGKEKVPPSWPNSFKCGKHVGNTAVGHISINYQLSPVNYQS